MEEDAKVLVVDDDLSVLSLIEDVLSEEGFGVLTAANSLVAFEMLHTYPEIGVLITDINMPGEGDGRALAQFVATTRPDIAILVVSGHPLDKKNRLPARARFLMKPFSFPELIKEVASLLSRPTNKPVDRPVQRAGP
jgi:DNA-binding response OmpR family regulator